MPHQSPATADGLESIKTAPDSKVMQLGKAFEACGSEKRSLLQDATQIHRTAAAPKRARNLHKLALGAPRFQAINHEKNGAGERRRESGIRLFRGNILRRCRDRFVLLYRFHPRFPATLVTR